MKDAFEGLEILNALADPARAPDLIERCRSEALEFKARSVEMGSRAQEAGAKQRDFRVTVPREASIPAPAFWGARVTGTREIPFAGMFEGMDLETLYRLHWGARGSGEEYEKLVREDFEPPRLRLQREAEEKGWLKPAAVYGYFPVRSEGQDLVVYDPAAFPAGSLAPRGKRYSFGYSACPDLADQARLFRLLDPEEAIGVTLTSAYQLVPEASTSAIIVHHPAAVYYMVRE